MNDRLKNANSDGYFGNFVNSLSYSLLPFYKFYRLIQSYVSILFFKPEWSL